MKENPKNRSILLRLFKIEWLKNRDKEMKILAGRKTKVEQLKLEL